MFIAVPKTLHKNGVRELPDAVKTDPIVAVKKVSGIVKDTTER
jgi:hypothetical protein